jgi:AraC family transcriptional regulator
MQWSRFSSVPGGSADSAIAQVAYRVEQHHVFSGGHVEIRRYHWSRAVEDVIVTEDDTLVLNMALSTRPAQTRMARIRDNGEDRPSDLGRVMIMVPGQRYRLSAPSGAFRSIRCVIRRDWLQLLVGGPIDWTAFWRDAVPLSPGAEIEGLLARIHRELRQERLGQARAIEAYAQAMAVELARRLLDGWMCQLAQAKGGLSPWRLKLIRDRVWSPAPAPRVAELAVLCGLTERQLRRAFKAETGECLGRFIDEATMERARVLLAASDRHIGSIANELGFASATSFSCAFRRIAGVSPSLLRRRKA